MRGRLVSRIEGGGIEDGGRERHLGEVTLEGARSSFTLLPPSRKRNPLGSGCDKHVTRLRRGVLLTCGGPAVAAALARPPASPGRTASRRSALQQQQHPRRSPQPLARTTAARSSPAWAAAGKVLPQSYAAGSRLPPEAAREWRRRSRLGSRPRARTAVDRSFSRLGQPHWPRRSAATAAGSSSSSRSCSGWRGGSGGEARGAEPRRRRRRRAGSRRGEASLAGAAASAET